MKKIIFFINIGFFLFFSSIINGHGFCGATKIKRSNLSWPIEQIYRNPQKQKLWVSSFDLQLRSIENQDVMQVGKSESNCYIRIAFDINSHNDIICTPTQELFLFEQQQFVPACQLQAGDNLLSMNKIFATIQSIELVEIPLTVYALEIAQNHNFFVGNYSILAHNSALPVLMSFGTCLGSGVTLGGMTGGCFGPITFAGGVALGGAIGIAVKLFSDKIRSHYLLHFDIDKVAEQLKGHVVYKESDEAQAPGKPTENDGFIPKKNWDGKKVKNPNGPGYGWPDKKGNVWIPTGPKGHGCPHWDVEKPDGDYENIVPGGRIRGKK